MPNIIIAGYGVFGSQLTKYLTEKNKNIKIQAVVEPNRHKRDLIKKFGIETYEHILDLPAQELASVDVLVDCSPRGQGIKNKALYQELGTKAIFQNGEESKDIGRLYYPGLVSKQNKHYLKMPLCSGLTVIKILDALKQNHM